MYKEALILDSILRHHAGMPRQVASSEEFLSFVEEYDPTFAALMRRWSERRVRKMLDRFMPE
jgi:hypothetical protein